jgi:hypothetical protein
MTEKTPNRTTFWLYKLHAGVILAASALGMLLSFGAQAGGIHWAAAFVAPILGPWSQTLSPNTHPMSVWTIEYTVFAECLGVALVCSMLGTYFAKTRWLRHASIGVSAFGLVVWVLSGLAKVVLEMH